MNDEAYREFGKGVFELGYLYTTEHCLRAWYNKICLIKINVYIPDMCYLDLNVYLLKCLIN